MKRIKDRQPRDGAAVARFIAAWRKFKDGIDPDYYRENPNACGEWLDERYDEMAEDFGLRLHEGLLVPL